MCGVAGILHLDGRPASSVRLKAMTDAIAHRGPDGDGNYVDGPLGLGHRRLAIIDLSPAGRQPMLSRDGRYVMSYNGEIYNYRELREELSALGHQFHTQTDSEVLLNSLIEWGPRALDKLNGIFALALWDKKERSLWLIRDRYGIKPLYYTQAQSTVLFASEVKGIMAHSDYRAEMDQESLIEYFSFQNFFTDRTLFKDVRLLPAGCHLKIKANDKAIPAPVRYWDYSFSEPTHPADETEYLEELERLFRQAVSRQLVSDVDVGAYLSGGMDSGSITALAALELPHMKSFTCGFDLNSASGMELSFDERAAAEHMSYLFKTEHYEMILKAGDMERVMPRLCWHLEEPRVGQCYPNFYAAQLASKFVRVVLSGAGGDELFGGYPWRYYRAVVNDDFEQYIDKYYSYWQRLLPSAQIPAIFAPIWSNVKDVSTRDIFRNVFSGRQTELRQPEDYVNHSLYLEAKTFMHGLLVVEDKMSMAHSLETRVPFLDNDLVDFAMKVPTKLKLGQLTEVSQLNENDLKTKMDRYQRANDGKIILRKMMTKLIPEAVTKREKQGFSAPDASWFKGESMEYVRSRLFNPHARIYDYMDRTAVQALVSEHLEGRQNRRLLIWSLLNVEQWCEEFLGRRNAVSGAHA